MIAQKQNRKLTTILSADVVGYSRLVSVNEADTIRLLISILNTTFPEIAARYQGRIVKLVGDGALMEFQSVVDAVNFAVETKETVAKRQTNLPEDKRIEFRIGINVGDVIVDGDDIFGTGVNVAARIEELAESGGIYVSGAVYDHVKDIVQHKFQNLGTKKVKNIPGRIQVFRYIATQTDNRSNPPSAPRSGRSALVALMSVLGIGAIAFVGYMWLGATQSDDVTLPQNAVAARPDKTAIAVLPFVDMSAKIGPDNLASAITNDLITDLSKISGIAVMASSRKEFIDHSKTGETAESQQPRYFLDGSVQRAGPSLRVNAQLIDTRTGVHVWAERFNGDVSNIFAMQDLINFNTVIAVRLLLLDRSAR